MIELLDTTLRDGAQAEGITFSLEDKKQITLALDELGIQWIEAGNPGANPMDEQFFRQMEDVRLRYATLVAFGSTCRPGFNPSGDPALKKLFDCSAPVKTVFGKSAISQAVNVLRCEPAENLRMISDTISFLKESGCRVWFDAEHFFDGYLENQAYALRTLQYAKAAGADRIVLCDTRGATLPDQIAAICQAVRKQIQIPLGIHCHNDCGLAVACSLEAVLSGCDQVQGTIGGIGERCGNTDLCTMIPLLSLKKQLPCLPEGNLRKLTHISRSISEIMNVVPNTNAPFIGHSAFAHKAGMHIDGVLKDAHTYEQINPEDVGNQRRFLISDQTGRAGMYARLGKLFPDLNRDSAEMALLIRRLKEREADGYTYENADGSFELLALDTLGRRPRFFQVMDYHVLCQRLNPSPDPGAPSAQAYLKVNVNGKEEINAAEGDGPVNALDLALRKTLSLFFPSVSKMSLQDFKVRVLNSVGTASLVRVSIESSDGIHIWNTVGVSNNIIEASLKGLIDSVDYMLTNYVPREEVLNHFSAEAGMNPPDQSFIYWRNQRS